MKKKYILISTVLLLLLLISGSTLAWFTHSVSVNYDFKMGTVEVKVLDSVIKQDSDKEYKAEIKVQSLGSKKTYVRVRLIPQWSNPSFPIPNVKIELKDNSAWVRAKPDDGYLYYKYYLTNNEKTLPLKVKIDIGDLEPIYQDAQLTLKVVAEGVQTREEAWKEVWGIHRLPFTPNKSRNP